MPPEPNPVFETLPFGRHQVPALWQFMLPEDFMLLRPPAERLATCDACYEVACARYRADCQCCTYFPQLPNFILGFALEDADAHATVADLIDRGHALPQGLVASPQTFTVAVEAYAQDRFGTLPSMVCPFVEPATFNCRIYALRNSVCSTFFCANDHGDDGKRWWDRVQAIVGRVETVLSQWALDQVGFDSHAYAKRLDGWSARVDEASEPESGAWSTAIRADLWGDWYGREHELFASCAEALSSHRSDLFALACEQPFVEALDFERAARDAVPPAYRSEVPRVAEAPGQHEPLESLWYKLQLSSRQLWALPFNGGRVRLNPSVRIEEAAAEVPGRGDRPYVISGGNTPLFLDEAQVTALRLFDPGRRLDETLFAAPEITALDDARGLLAECLRRAILLAESD